ncbi:MAG: threonine synthase [Bacteroidetes bacterium]|nr:threonine synthase [Bacteroidota bacterium]
MKFYSTNNKTNLVSFKEAVLNGIANDGGLFMPVEIPKLPQAFFSSLDKLSFKEISFIASRQIFGQDLKDEILSEIINSTITFDAPLVKLNNELNILELFHGPTLAFKDFGARFMANVMAYLNKDSDREIKILVATSGDTGSAVANGFYKVKGINVVLLYPSQKVSKIQEQQLTTLGENISALEVKGTFDDCQRLVKQAFLDKDLLNHCNLSSANSINIARLLPQSFYYFYAYSQIKDKSLPLIISVPSGNFGNLTAGLIAMEMGLPVHKFIAATNANDVFPKYLETSVFQAKPSVKTLSNAMDVGNPSNFVRILDLYNHDHNLIKQKIFSTSFSDSETIEAMKEIKTKYNYIIDPHGAVGYLAMKKYLSENYYNQFNGVILETAHPAKFADIVEDVLDTKIEVPERLQTCLTKKKSSIEISKDYIDFKNFILSN